MRTLASVFLGAFFFSSLFISVAWADTRDQLHKKVYQTFDNPKTHSYRVDSGGDTTSRHSGNRNPAPSQGVTSSGGDTTSGHSFGGASNSCSAGTRRDFLGRCLPLVPSQATYQSDSEKKKDVLAYLILRALAFLLLLAVVALVLLFLAAGGVTLASLFA